MYINGEWRDATTAFTTLNPSTGAPLAEIPRAGDADVREAVSAARQALPAWRALDIAARANHFTEVLKRLRAEYGSEGAPSPLKTLITDEVGKRLPEADIEVAESADMLEYFINAAPEFLGRESVDIDKTMWPTKSSSVAYTPVGIVAIIKPWNYPLELPLWSLVPALLAGNTVVFKPAEDASLVGKALVELFEDALPTGVLNLITGGADVGRSLVASDVDMVSFTGSLAAGKEIAEYCGRHMRRCTLELGGNDPAIVLPDVDIAFAASGLTWGCFCNSGQVCVRPKRVFVHESIADRLVAAIVDQTARLRRDIDFGPLINEKQLMTVERQVASARSAGAQILAGGVRLDEAGYYFAPTIMVEVPSAASVMTEECFGPVMPIVTFKDTDEALASANATHYGLGASVWCADLHQGAHLAEQIDAGMVWLNDVNVAFAQAPWGGVKSSGVGSELGKWGFHEYVVPKHISIDTDNTQPRGWWYPY